MWTCNCCGSDNEPKYDYCPYCEECGCTKNNPRCEEVNK